MNLFLSINYTIAKGPGQKRSTQDGKTLFDPVSHISTLRNLKQCMMVAPAYMVRSVIGCPSSDVTKGRAVASSLCAECSTRSIATRVTALQYFTARDGHRLDGANIAVRHFHTCRNGAAEAAHTLARPNRCAVGVLSRDKCSREW